MALGLVGWGASWRKQTSREAWEPFWVSGSGSKDMEAVESYSFEYQGDGSGQMEALRGERERLGNQLGLTGILSYGK